MVSSTDFFEINLHDGDGNILLGIDDGNTGQKLIFDVVNTSGKDITLDSLTSDTSENKDKYHFCFAFRPGTLLLSNADKVTLQESNNGWSLKRDGDNFYLIGSGQAVWKNQDKRTFTLQNISAAPDGGARGTRVEIKYDNFKIGDAPLTGNRLKNLNILNQRGKKQVPLYVGFIGSSTILNDGSENTLTLSIQLLPRLESSLVAKSLVVGSTSDSSKIDINLIKTSNIDLKNLTATQAKLLQSIDFRKVGEKLSESLSNQPLIQPLLNQLVQIFSDATKSYSSNYENLKKFLVNPIIKPLLSPINQSFVDQFLNDFLKKFNQESLNGVSQDELVALLSLLKDLGLSDQNLTKLQGLNIIDKVADNIKRSLSSQEVPLKALDEAIKFTISFDVATAEEQQPLNNQWALVSQNDADNIRPEIAEGSPNPEKWIYGGLQKQGITPQWSFICTQGLNLGERSEILRLSISNIKTTLLAGYANLYVHYENIPGYWDGHITVPIHKGPLVYREKEISVGKDSTGKDQTVKVACVGIGTDKPQAKLHISLNKDNENNPSLQIPALTVDGLTVLNQKKQTASSISIKLNGSSFNTNLSDELKKPYVEVRGQKKLFETQQSPPRLFTQIIKTNGSLGNLLQHNTYDGEWNKWAKDVQQNANDGDIVAVVSYDAIGKPLDTDQDAISLLTSLNARKILNYPYITTDPLTRRIPYALLFIKGKNESIEVLNYDSGGNAFIDTTYENLLNLSNYTLTVNGKVKATKFVGEGICVSGMIMMWSGIVADIPSGWVLCDGRNGTPNLTERFIVAAGGKYKTHNFGDADKHNHKINMDIDTEEGGEHKHSLMIGNDRSWTSSKAKKGDNDDVVNSRGNSQIDTESSKHKHKLKILDQPTSDNERENRPKWYSLCFIMKI